MGIQRVPSVPFAQIANSALRDKRLSFKARGVLALVLSNVGEWEATGRWIEQQSIPDGTAAVKSALHELSELGYRVVRHERNASGQIRTVVDWYHEPVDRRAENPTTGSSDHREGRPAIEDHPSEDHPSEHDQKTPPVAVATSDEFDAFWEVYPRKVGKRAARRAWESACRDSTPSAIIAGAARYAADPNREPAYTAHPSTWLNRGGWDDDPIPSKQGAGRPSGTRLYVEAAERFVSDGNPFDELDDAPRLAIGGSA